jgi:hypothetical protein
MVLLRHGDSHADMLKPSPAVSDAFGILAISHKIVGNLALPVVALLFLSAEPSAVQDLCGNEISMAVNSLQKQPAMPCGFRPARWLDASMNASER